MGMININTGQYTSPTANFQALPAYGVKMVANSLKKAVKIAKTKHAANVYFKGIAEGSRSLLELLSDSEMWINYHPTFNGLGYTPGHGFVTEFALTPFAFKAGEPMVLATIIHELAHCNGAPGGESQVAERALIACGLGRQSEIDGKDDPKTAFNPTVKG